MGLMVCTKLLILFACMLAAMLHLTEARFVYKDDTVQQYMDNRKKIVEDDAKLSFYGDYESLFVKKEGKNNGNNGNNDNNDDNNDNNGGNGDGEVDFSEKEMAVHILLVNLKWEDYKTYKSDMSIDELLQLTARSLLFELIKKFPKGALLRIFNAAAIDISFMLKRMNDDRLWMCSEGDVEDANFKLIEFRYSANKPSDQMTSNPSSSTDTVVPATTAAPDASKTNSKWYNVKSDYFEIASRKDAFLSFMKSKLTLYHEDFAYKKDVSHSDTWKKFLDIYNYQSTVLKLDKNWCDIPCKLVEEILADGLQYFELHSTFNKIMKVTDEKYEEMNIKAVINCMNDSIKNCKHKTENFSGAKFIFSPPRKSLIDPKTNNENADVQDAINLDLGRDSHGLVGYDLVGHDDNQPLNKYMEMMKNKTPIILQAGQTTNFSFDDGLVDALTLEAIRIGHGLTLHKHPALLKLVKEKKIPIEVCPLSNKVLKFVGNTADHPSIKLKEALVDLIICSDDPAFWRASPVSHDFYEALMGIASPWEALDILNQWAKNSIDASGMSDIEKKAAHTRREKLYVIFIDETYDLMTPGKRYSKYAPIIKPKDLVPIIESFRNDPKMVVV